MEIRGKIILVLVIASLVFSCSRKTETGQQEFVRTDRDLIALTGTQVELAEIDTGSITRKVLTGSVEVTGNIEADPNQKAMVSPAMKGYLQHIYVHVGEYVRKNDVLASLSHPDYITLQQQYLETKSLYEYYKTDFKRQGELSIENAASLKTMQRAQNEFEMVEAKLEALKAHLEFIGISADTLTVHNIARYITLRSPVEGSVTAIEGNLGMLCPEEVPLFQIVGSRNAILHLAVFERDAVAIKPGQEVEFQLISDPHTKRKAVIHTVSRAIEESKTIDVHARIRDRSSDLLPGMFVKARIVVDADSVFAVPETSIARYGDKNYIFIAQTDSTFKAIVVEKGISSEGWVEIMEPSDILLGSSIVTRGSYYLLSSMQEE